MLFVTRDDQIAFCLSDLYDYFVSRGATERDAMTEAPNSWRRFMERNRD